MIEFSKLPQKEKEKYIQFLVDNNIEFQQSDTGYMASFKVQNKENMDPSSKKSLLKKSASPVRRKLAKEAVLALLQEVYSQKFDDASMQIKKKQTVSEDFNDYVQRVAKERMIDLQASLNFQNEHISLFQKFLNKEYEEEDLMYFLFVRAIVEKEMGQQIYTRSNVVELTSKYLNQKQLNNIIETIFGDSQEQQIADLLELLDHKQKISAFDFLLLALQKYHNDRQQPTLQDQITQNVFSLLDQFFQDQIQDVDSAILHQSKLIVTDLLTSIFKGDKRLWFQRISNPKPEELMYVENLQKLFQKLPPDCSQEDLKFFSRKLLQTPQLGRALAQLLE